MELPSFNSITSVMVLILPMMSLNDNLFASGKTHLLLEEANFVLEGGCGEGKQLLCILSKTEGGSVGLFFPDEI